MTNTLCGHGTVGNQVVDRVIYGFVYTFDLSHNARY